MLQYNIDIAVQKLYDAKSILRRIAVQKQKRKMKLFFFGSVALVLAAFFGTMGFKVHRELNEYNAMEQQVVEAVKLSAVGHVPAGTADGRIWWRLITQAHLCGQYPFLSENRNHGAIVQNAVCASHREHNTTYVAVLGVANFNHGQIDDSWALTGADWKMAYYDVQLDGAIDTYHRYEGGAVEYMDPKSDWTPLLRVPAEELPKIKDVLLHL